MPKSCDFQFFLIHKICTLRVLNKSEQIWPTDWQHPKQCVHRRGFLATICWNCVAVWILHDVCNPLLDKKSVCRPLMKPVMCDNRQIMAWVRKKFGNTPFGHTHEIYRIVSQFGVELLNRFPNIFEYFWTLFENNPLPKPIREKWVCWTSYPNLLTGRLKTPERFHTVPGILWSP